MYLDGRDFQTVWQLAHNWANADPNKSDPNTLSFELVEAIHRLLSAIVIRAIAARTRRISILDNDSIGTVIFDSIHHIKINTCLRKDRFDKDYLDSIYVKRSDVLNWCDRERIAPPALWAPEKLLHRLARGIGWSVARRLLSPTSLRHGIKASCCSRMTKHLHSLRWSLIICSSCCLPDYAVRKPQP